MAAEPITMPSPESPEPCALSTIFAERERYVCRGDYKLLGRLQYILCEQGLIDFSQDGPAIAQFTDAAGEHASRLAILEPWAGLPTRMELLPELCPDCQTPCIECEATGQHVCKYPGCGGEGRIVTNWKKCPRFFCRTTPRKGCSLCHGTGRAPDQSKECGCCKGTKVMTCSRCKGTKKMSTGYKGGAPLESAGMCASCNGNGRQRRPAAQDFKSFHRGDVEGYAVLGPVFKLWMSSLPGDPAKFALVEFAPDADGNLPCLFVAEPEKQGQGWYLFGGSEPHVTEHAR